MTMDSPSLLLVCVIAFLAVFVLLGLLALIMRLLIAALPEKPKSDAPLLAAVTTAASAAHPGMKVTRVEEEK